MNTSDSGTNFRAAEDTNCEIVPTRTTEAKAVLSGGIGSGWRITAILEPMVGLLGGLGRAKNLCGHQIFESCLVWDNECRPAKSGQVAGSELCQSPCHCFARSADNLCNFFVR